MVEVDPHSDLLHICIVKPKNMSPAAQCDFAKGVSILNGLLMS